MLFPFEHACFPFQTFMLSLSDCRAEPDAACSMHAVWMGLWSHTRHCVQDRLVNFASVLCSAAKGHCLFCPCSQDRYLKAHDY